MLLGEPRPHATTRDAATRVALAFNLVLGTLLAATTALFLGMWIWPGDDPHGGVFALVPAFWAAPAAALFFVSAWAHWRRAPGRWHVQAFPLGYAALLLGFLTFG